MIKEGKLPFVSIGMVAPSKRLNRLWPVKYYLYLISCLPALYLISPLPTLKTFQTQHPNLAQYPGGREVVSNCGRYFCLKSFIMFSGFCSLRSSNKASVASNNDVSVRAWLRYFYDFDGAVLFSYTLKKTPDTQKLVVCLNRITGPLPALQLLVFY